MFKKIYKDRQSIFVENLEEVLSDTTSLSNKFDEYVLKCIGVGYMMMAFESHPEIQEKLTEDDLDNLIYSIGCHMEDVSTREGFYVKQRHFDVEDIRLLAECVYSAKFIAEGQAKRLVDVVCDFVSQEQAEKIKHNAC